MLPAFPPTGRHFGQMDRHGRPFSRSLSILIVPFARDDAIHHCKTQAGPRRLGRKKTDRRSSRMLRWNPASVIGDGNGHFPGRLHEVRMTILLPDAMAWPELIRSSA